MLVILTKQDIIIKYFHKYFLYFCVYQIKYCYIMLFISNCIKINVSLKTRLYDQIYLSVPKSTFTLALSVSSISNIGFASKWKIPAIMEEGKILHFVLNRLITAL